MKALNPHDIIADYYNSLFKFPKHFDKGLVNEIDILLKKKESKKILECGCGTGNPSIGLSLMGYDIYAIDSSPNMIAIAYQNAQNVKAKLSFFELEMEQVKKIGQKFDCIICHDSLYHFKDDVELISFFKILKSILNEKGFIYIATKRWDIELNKEYRKYIELRGTVSVNEGSNFIVFDICKDNKLAIFLAKESNLDVSYIKRVEFPWYPRAPEKILMILKNIGFSNCQLIQSYEEEKYNCVGITAEMSALTIIKEVKRNG